MLIEEIIRSCRSESVAEAAVASIGASFARNVAVAADACGLSVGEFTAHSVARFARSGGEAEMRSVASIMGEAQEPILAGLQCILSIMLSAGRVRDDLIVMPRTAFMLALPHEEPDRRYAYLA